MKLRNKEMFEVNLVCAALKKAGIRFTKNDVTVLDNGFVRLSYRPGRDLVIDDILKELKAIGYEDARIDNKKEISDDRRWFSIDTWTFDIKGEPKRDPVRYVSVDEVYCTVYIDV